MRCLNPKCRRTFTPGHYGERQRICARPECRRWYRGAWAGMRRPPRAISGQDMGRIVAAAERWGRDFAALLLVARETGCRKGELLGLTWRDVLGPDGRARPSVSIRGQWSDREGFKGPKTGNGRVQPFSAAARAALDSVRDRRRAERPDSRVFAMSEASAWRRFVGVQTALGIENPETGFPYRFHDLRHSVGVECARAGRLDLARRMLGHKRLETTMIYAEQTADEILTDYEAIRLGTKKKRGKSDA